MNVTGASFYSSAEAEINSRLIAGNTCALNLEQAIKHGKLDSALIMGLGDGDLVGSMSSSFNRIEVIEGSSELVTLCVERFSNQNNINFHCSYFEDFNIKKRDQVDVIFGNHVLEHVDDPVAVLEKTKEWLASDGLAIFSVPNAESIHRKIGVEMGLLNDVHQLNSQDFLVGHQRVYDKEMLKKDISRAGYEICEIGGFNLKIVSQKQMSDWSTELITAIFKVSRTCPIELCSNLYVSCKLL